MSDARRVFIEAAYARLRETLAAKEVRAEHLKSAALDALTRAKVQLEDLEMSEVAGELDRLHTVALRDEEPTP